MSAVFQFLFKYKLFVFQKGRLFFDAHLSLWLFVTILATGILISAAFYRSRGLSNFRQLSTLFSKERLLLLVLRGSTLILLVLGLFRPSLHVSTLLPRENIAAVLLDDSKSMTIKDASGMTRIEALQKFLQPKQSNFFPDLERRFQTRLYRFSRNAERIESIQALRSEGRSTSLETALDDVLKELDSAPLANIIVFTDGADNVPESLLPILRKLQVKQIAVSVCGIGSPQLSKDIEVTQASAPQTVLPNSITTAAISLKSNGYAGKNVILELREQGKLVQTKPVVLTRDNDLQTIELDIATRGQGLKLFTVSVKPEPDEAVQQNNTQNLLLNVEDSRPKILYIEGTPRWEFKFIREAILPDKNLQLMTLLRTSGNKFYRQGVENENSLASGFPTTRQELFQYKGLILGSIESAFFSNDQMKMMADFVAERGAGLMMLGGKKSFDEGKYHNSPLADVLPVILGQSEPGQSFVLQPLKFRLTAYGQSHLITRLVMDEGENAKRWNLLPPLEEYNQISSIKPGATALGVGGGGRGTSILLATQRYGRGRSVALMTSNSWVWQMGMPHEDNSHEIFWRQTLRWLVNSTPDQVNLQVDRNIISSGEPFNLQVEVNDPSFTRLNDATVVANILSPQGKNITLSLPWSVRKDGWYSARFTPTEDGIYRIQAKASGRGNDVGTAEQFFLSTDSNLEFHNAGQNKALLQRIASETGGRYYTLDNARLIPEEISYVERPNAAPQVLPLWDMPILFLLLCSLLLFEWLWRKRLGLA